MHLVTINGKKYKYESNFSKKGIEWLGKGYFLDKLGKMEKYLRLHNKYIAYEPKDYKDCSFKDDVRVGKGIFSVNMIRWEDSLYHYVDKHNIKPSDEFIEFIMDFKYPEKQVRRVLGKINGVEFIKNNMKYLKIERNDLMVMDALMVHGGYNKKYTDDDMNVVRYSEHAGFLDFRNDGLEKFVIMGKKHLTKDDNEIYLSTIRLDALDYEYVFHTHPPTPKPGGRAKESILYEYPSFADVMVFIRHYNKGTTQGSIVVAPEGLYIIRPKEIGIKKISGTKSDDDMLNGWRDAYRDGQENAIQKYGINFSEKHFYSVIAQDLEFANMMNEFFGDYGIHIDYYPRKKDINDNWVLRSIYLPVQVVEPDI